MSRSWLHPPLPAVQEVVARALAEDLGVLGDVTAALVPDDIEVRAVIRTRAPGVLAGSLAATETYRALDPAVSISWQRHEGDRVEPGEVLASLVGPLRSVLTGERTALNLLGHLSGIATLTRRFVDAAGPAVAIRDTRKTTPGLRALEKAAVRAGGGTNHRGSLSEGILVKDNHLAGLSIPEAVAEARRLWPSVPCEVECDDLEQVRLALAAGADMILLDNMSPAQVLEACREVEGRVPLEVSGGVSLDSVADYARAGATFISVGAITHSAAVLDVGLDLQERVCS